MSSIKMIQNLVQGALSECPNCHGRTAVSFKTFEVGYEGKIYLIEGLTYKCKDCNEECTDAFMDRLNVSGFMLAIQNGDLTEKTDEDKENASNG